MKNMMDGRTVQFKMQQYRHNPPIHKSIIIVIINSYVFTAVRDSQHQAVYFSYVTEENYIAVVLHLKVKEPMAEISPLHEVLLNVTSRKDLQEYFR
jgi:hypothetical protein